MHVSYRELNQISADMHAKWLALIFVLEEKGIVTEDEVNAQLSRAAKLTEQIMQDEYDRQSKESVANDMASQL